MLRQRQNGNGRITGARRLMDGGSIPPSSTTPAFMQVFEGIFGFCGVILWRNRTTIQPWPAAAKPENTSRNG